MEKIEFRFGLNHLELPNIQMERLYRQFGYINLEFRRKAGTGSTTLKTSTFLFKSVRWDRDPGSKCR